MLENTFKSLAFIPWALGLSLILFTGTALAENPYLSSNNSWISIGGTVENVSADGFILDYGDGAVTVEMDDGDRDADGYKLIAGDKVMVHGRVDRDLFEKTSIEASSVFVEKLGTSFYASSVDEEDYLYTITPPVVISETVLQGLVTDVDETEFTIDTGLKRVTVDVGEMAYNPLDETGYQKIENGDLVRVSGTIDRQLFEGRELMAETIVELVD